MQQYAHEQEITSVADLVDAGRRLTDVFPAVSNIWYRGHEQIEYRLQASVHRDFNRLGELNLTGNFRTSAPSRSAHVIGFEDYGAWLSLMQHYGLPTRLLDWTSSPLIAAFFAVSHKYNQARPGDACIWAICPQKLMSGQPGMVDDTGRRYNDTPPQYDPAIMGALKASFVSDDLIDDNERKGLGRVLPWPAREVDVRMMVQSSCFTIHDRTEPLDGDTMFKDCLALLTIPEASRKTLFGDLEALGIRRDLVFPDLGNLAEYLKAWLKPIYPKIA